MTASAQGGVATTTALGSVDVTVDVEPWDYYEGVRTAGDVVWDETLQAWLVSSYDLIKEVGRRDDDDFVLSYVIDERRPAPMGLSPEEWRYFIGLGAKHFIVTDAGEPHERQHRWWMHAFTPRVLRQWQESLFRPICHRQIDAFAADGRADLVTQYANRVAPRVIASMMGLPHDDDGWLKHMDSLFVPRLALKQRIAESTVERELVDRALAATRELEEMLRPYVRARRNRAGDDLISMVWRDAEQLFGEDWDELDVLGLVTAVWEGGSGTTMYSTANGLYLLLTRPDLREQVEAGAPKAVPNLIEEALRLYGPVFMRPRIAVRDVELGGVSIRRGEQVVLLLVSGSRDPDHYAHAPEPDLARKAPRDHLAFMFGPRTCPGQALGRVELEEIVAALLDRLPSMRLDPEAEPPVFRGLLTRRWLPLNVVF